MNTPILLIVFNRPITTEKVFKSIKLARPSKLYISADGPRNGNISDVNQCAKVKKIVSDIDWPCEVFHNYSSKNLGCKIGVSSAITWFFKNESEGIILEDDCVPSSDFFEFVPSLLERYRHDERIGQIAGTNFLSDGGSNNDQYVFSYLGSIWGWAGWQRSWNNFDIDLVRWTSSEIRNKIFTDFSLVTALYIWCCYLLSKKYKLNTWDYQWFISSIMSNQLTIVPCVNLIKNIGIEGVHTKGATRYNNMSYGDLDLGLNFEPEAIQRNKVFEKKYEKEIISKVLFKMLASVVLRKLNLYNFIKHNL